MKLFYKYAELKKETLQDIHKRFSTYYDIDLNQIFDDYLSDSHEVSSQYAESTMKVKNTGISSSENKLTLNEPIPYDEQYFKYLLKFEKTLNKLRNPHTYDAIKEECYHTFSLSIIDLLSKCNSTDESEQRKYLRDYYGINLPSIYDFSKTNQELLSLEADFQKKYGINIGACFVQCFSSFQKQKQVTEKNTNSNETPHFCISTFYEKCWDIVTLKRIVPKFIVRKKLAYIHTIPKIKKYRSFKKPLFNTSFEFNMIRRYEPCFSGHRRDWQNDLASVPGETDIFKLLQVTMDEHHTNATKKGIANYVRDQLEMLSSNWNDAIKIAVLLDLYWNLKGLSSNSSSIKLSTFHDDESNSRINAPCFHQREFNVIDSRKYKIAKELEETIEMQHQGKLLYPFVPSVKYDPSRKLFEVSESFAELQLNFLLTPNIIDFFRMNYQLIGKGLPHKHKTFKDALSIYTEQFSFTKVSDYYCLESLMGFNLSMKLYDYLWPMANKIMNTKSSIGREKKECFDKYMTSIICSLYKIKSPYLRLRVADIIIQSYGHSKYIKESQYLLSMEAIQSFLDIYVKIINKGYQIIYDSMFYYYGKEMLSAEDPSPFLNDLEDLINHKYKCFIQIDPDSILADFAPYDNCKDDFGYIFNELYINERGKPRDFYSKIMQNILINNYQIHLKADK